MDRVNRVGGGVIVYVKDTLRATEIKIDNIDGVEITGATVDTGSAKLTFVNVYRPPNTSPETDVLLYGELRKISVGHIIIVGDFNCPNVNYDLLDADNEGMRLLEFLDDNFLLQLIDSPTRANNILDLLIVSQVNLVRNIEISEPIGNSDHNMIKFNINLENKIMSNSQTVPDFKNANFEGFGNSLAIANWEDLLGGNAEEMWGEFLRVFKDQERNYIPYKIKRTSGDLKPKWWNIAIGNALNSRNRAYKRYKSSPTVENTNSYFSSRRECKRLVRFYKREFELNIARECKKNPKMFFSYVNKKSIKNPIGPVIDADGTLKTSNVDIAKTLNEFFLSVFTEKNLSHIGT